MKFRYGGNNKVGDRFFGPHHNPEVQNLLNSGFVAFLIPIVNFDTEEHSRLAESAYLRKVWKDDHFSARPKWLLNRNRNAIGFPSGDLHPNKTEENRAIAAERARGNNWGVANKGRENTWMLGDKNHMRDPEHRTRAREQVGKLHTPETRGKARATRERTINDPDYINPVIGKPRPDLVNRNKSVEKRVKVSEFMKQKSPCPYCGWFMNPGNLAQHIRSKHKSWESMSS